MNVHKNDHPAKIMRVRKKRKIYILFTKYPACRRSQKNLIYVNTWLWGRSKVKRQIEKPYYSAYFFKQFSFSISKRGYIRDDYARFPVGRKFPPLFLLWGEFPPQKFFSRNFFFTILFSFFFLLLFFFFSFSPSFLFLLFLAHFCYLSKFLLMLRIQFSTLLGLTPG